MENKYRQGFEEIQEGKHHYAGNGWMRPYILDQMIMAKGMFFTRLYVIDLIEQKTGSRIDPKTAGQILNDICIGMRNSRQFAVKPKKERVGKTKIPVTGYCLYLRE